MIGLGTRRTAPSCFSESGKREQSSSIARQPREGSAAAVSAGVCVSERRSRPLGLDEPTVITDRSHRFALGDRSNATAG